MYAQVDDDIDSNSFLFPLSYLIRTAVFRKVQDFFDGKPCATADAPGHLSSTPALSINVASMLPGLREKLLGLTTLKGLLQLKDKSSTRGEGDSARATAAGMFAFPGRSTLIRRFSSRPIRRGKWGWNNTGRKSAPSSPTEPTFPEEDIIEEIEKGRESDCDSVDTLEIETWKCGFKDKPLPELPSCSTRSTLSKLSVPGTGSRGLCHPDTLPMLERKTSTDAISSEATSRAEEAPGPRIPSNYIWRVVPLASGGFGNVFTLKGLNEGEKIVMKAVRMSPDRETVWVHAMEIKALRRLRKHPHQNIVEQPNLGGNFEYEWWSKKTATIYTLHAYYPADLADVMKLRDRDPDGFQLQLVGWEIVRVVIIDIANGLNHLHHLGIIHRDIKPENIFVDVAGYFRIGDFGGAYIPVGRPKSSIMVRSQHCCGITPNFAPPELIMSHLDTRCTKSWCFDESVDFWSLGMTVLDLVGHRPDCFYQGFKAKHSVEEMEEIIRANLAVLEEDRPVVVILKRCLEIFPSSRLHGPEAAQLVAKLESMSDLESSRPRFANYVKNTKWSRLRRDDKGGTPSAMLEDTPLLGQNILLPANEVILEFEAILARMNLKLKERPNYQITF
ncbi:unnamed protein product [Cyclocybe aegerita]|uniref:non-specific serine/threonine protein kinase n=1 Tax=Cyclocybe aegerita TaxID=1973307 RepID=A0A8S0W3J4_CYCAE|nr:unnamed protein product [Cyclocybe aegerita]